MNDNLLIFAGNDMIAHQFLNKFIPDIIDQGITPVIVKVKNKHHHFNHNEMKRYGFYEEDLLNEHLFPYIEKNPSNTYKMKSFSQLEEYYDLQVIHATNVNDPDFINDISEIDFIGAFSIRCFQIFKTPIIQRIKEKGFFCNSHPGMLPDYRGVWCLLRGMVAQEEKLGWNLHEIEEGIDTGAIVNRAVITNDYKSDMLTLFTRTIPHLVTAWKEYVTAAENPNGVVIPATQPKQGNYYTYPTDTEVEKWLRSGALKPLSSKAMVQMYCDMFYDHSDRFTDDAQQFKVHLINKVAQFETMMEMEEANAPYKTSTARKAA